MVSRELVGNIKGWSNAFVSAVFGVRAYDLVCSRASLASLRAVMRGRSVGVWALCVVLLAVAFAVAGCGGGSDPATAGSGSDPAAGHGVLAGDVAPLLGGVAGSGGVVARVGGNVITAAALRRGMEVELHGETGGDAILPVPPSFSGCVAGLAALAAKAAKHVSQGVLRHQCSVLYEGLLGKVLGPMISAEWVVGGAEELGLQMSDAEVKHGFAAEVGSGASEAEFRKLLARSGENVPELLFNFKEQMLEEKIRGKLDASVGAITPARVAGYYNANRASFAVIEQRDLELIKTKSLAEARRAKRELGSGVSFASVYRRLAGEQPAYDTSTHGLITGLKPHVFKEPVLNDAIFAAKAGVVNGPVRLHLAPNFDSRSAQDIQNINGYYVFVVQRIRPAYQKSLAQVKAALTKELPGILGKQALVTYIASWRAKWRAKTDCSPGYVVRKCRQYKPVPGEEPEDGYTLN